MSAAGEMAAGSAGKPSLPSPCGCCASRAGWCVSSALRCHLAASFSHALDLSGAESDSAINCTAV
jgi:hypothetical protein